MRFSPTRPERVRGPRPGDRGRGRGTETENRGRGTETEAGGPRPRPGDRGRGRGTGAGHVLGLGSRSRNRPRLPVSEPVSVAGLGPRQVAAGNRTSNAAPPWSRLLASIDPPSPSTMV